MKTIIASLIAVLLAIIFFLVFGAVTHSLAYYEVISLTVFSKISSSDLAKHLDSFIIFQGKARNSRSLSRKWALSIKPEDLNDKLESFIK